MPAPEDPSNVMAGAGGQVRTVSILAGGVSEDELGVLPIRMARVTAARIFAARMGAKKSSGRNFSQRSE